MSIPPRLRPPTPRDLRVTRGEIRAGLGTIDGAFVLWSALWAGGSLLAYGLVAAIIPNPVFGRQIPPEPFAVAVWLASAPLMGLVGATYTAPVPAPTPVGLARGEAASSDESGTTLGAIGAIGSFLAIGCPVCNKIALVLLGTGGALTIFAPIQPILGALSIALLAATLAWRLRLRARGGACAVA